MYPFMVIQYFMKCSFVTELASSYGTCIRWVLICLFPSYKMNAALGPGCLTWKRADDLIRSATSVATSRTNNAKITTVTGCITSGIRTLLSYM